MTDLNRQTAGLGEYGEGANDNGAPESAPESDPESTGPTPEGESITTDNLLPLQGS